MKLDSSDLKVLEALKEDGRATVRGVAKKIGAPVTTVHNRLKKLTKEGVIKRFTIEPDYDKLGRGVSAFVFASINHEKLVDAKHGIESLKRQLRSCSEVEQIYAVTGDIDLMLMVRVGSIKDLDEFLIRKLRNIKGIQQTTSHVVLEEG